MSIDTQLARMEYVGLGDKSKLREQLRKDVAEFLKRGGKIQKIPSTDRNLVVKAIPESEQKVIGLISKLGEVTAHTVAQNTGWSYSYASKVCNRAVQRGRLSYTVQDRRRTYILI